MKLYALHSGSVARCRVETAVDEPGDVFDMYGRFIGDLYVETKQRRLHVNKWLLESG